MFTNAQIFRIRRFFKNLIATMVYGSIIFVAIILYDAKFNIFLSANEKYVIYITGFMTLGILVAYRQIVTNNDFQRRQFSMIESSRLLRDNKFHRDKLNELIDYSNLVQKGEPISSESIHNLICEKKDGIFGDKPYKMTENGKKIRSHMMGILNNFEQLGIGILHNTLDEYIMKDGFELIVERNYNFYSTYITHIRTDENSSDFAENFEWLKERWKNKVSNKKTPRG